MISITFNNIQWSKISHNCSKVTISDAKYTKAYHDINLEVLPDWEIPSIPITRNIFSSSRKDIRSKLKLLVHNRKLKIHCTNWANLSMILGIVSALSKKVEVSLRSANYNDHSMNTRKVKHIKIKANHKFWAIEKLPHNKDIIRSLIKLKILSKLKRKVRKISTF